MAVLYCCSVPVDALISKTVQMGAKHHAHAWVGRLLTAAAQMNFRLSSVAPAAPYGASCSTPCLLAWPRLDPMHAPTEPHPQTLTQTLSKP